MRIAFIHNNYIDYRIPFFELLSQSYDVTFFFEKENVPNETQIDSNFSRTFKFRSLRFSPMLPLKLFLGHFDLFISGGLGYTNSVLALIVSRLMGKPFIIWSEEWYPEEFLCKNRFILKRKIVTYSSAFIAPGLKSASFLKYLGARDDVIFTAPNASIPSINNSEKPCATPQSNSLKSETIKILFLGRIVPSKGIDYLIKAFGLLERKGIKAVLIIAGQGPFLKELQVLVKKENYKNIVFTAQFANDVDKFFFYQNCDIFVLPSVYCGFVEGWGLVVNEAMYFGKPVIVTETVGAAYDLVKDGINGFIVPEKDIEALSYALSKIISDDILRKSMGELSKEIIEEGYKWSDMVRGFLKAIRYISHN